eukprot:EG_transcript_5393
MADSALSARLEALGLGQYKPGFRQLGVATVGSTRCLTEEDWVRLVPDPVHRAAIQQHCLARLADSGEPADDADDATLLPAAERRPLLGRGYTPPRRRASVTGSDPGPDRPQSSSVRMISVHRTPSSRTLARHPHQVQTDIPARLDRLPWCGWHWAVTLALGFAWVLDGFLVSLNSLVGPKLTEPATMGISTLESAVIGAVYISGAVVGALLFGYLSDKFGRRPFFVTIPAVYLTASFAAACAPTYVFFLGTMFAMGVGIGGEYSALTSALNELIPADVRGTVDLTVSGSYWLGACLAAVASRPLFDEAVLPADVGWRIAYGVPAVLGVGVVALRLYLPESPRWLTMQGRLGEAEGVMKGIEDKVERWTGTPLPDATHTVTVKVGLDAGLMRLFRILVCEHPDLSFLSFVLMVSQAFFYNAIYFTYVSVLATFHGIAPSRGGDFLIPFAIGNFLGSALLGRLFDVVGRKPMMVGTYGLSGLMLGGTMYLFSRGWLTAVTQTLCFSAVFFVASAAASSAMLTVSEVFTLEVRARAISVFWGLGTAAGGVSGPVLFGYLLEESELTNSKVPILYGYAIGAGLMLFAALVDAWLGVECTGQSLEAINAECHDADPEEPDAPPEHPRG